MKLFLVSTPRGVRFKVESSTGSVSIFNPTDSVNLNLLTSKLIGLDPMKGNVLKHLFGSTCEVSYMGSLLQIPLEGTIIMKREGPITAQYVADLYTGPDTILQISIEQLFKELDKRVERVRMSIESRAGEVTMTQEFPLGTFSDEALNVQRWL